MRSAIIHSVYQTIMSLLISVKYALIEKQVLTQVLKSHIDGIIS